MFLLYGGVDIEGGVNLDIILEAQASSIDKKNNEMKIQGIQM